MSTKEEEDANAILGCVILITAFSVVFVIIAFGMNLMGWTR